jgi:hypothetical protein
MGLHLTQRIAVFSELGQAFRAIGDPSHTNDLGFLGLPFQTAMQTAIQKAFAHNGWFEPHFTKQALLDWGQLLQKTPLEEWCATVPETNPNPKRVGIVMAGNLPLVGFHDFLTVLITGNKAVIKPSSDDAQLWPVIIKGLLELAPDWAAFIEVVPQIKNIDAIIATGSNNSARYFEHYFSKYPHIIRKSRHSVAVVNHQTTDAALQALAADIFTYFGLGCRSVSKIYLPHDFDVNRIFGNILDYNAVVQNKKYGNNYDYHRAIYMMNQQPFLENGFVIVREAEALATPVAVLHVERYQSLTQLDQHLLNLEPEIQCVVSDLPLTFPRCVMFGASQKPALNDYADGVDTLDFLLNL